MPSARNAGRSQIFPWNGLSSVGRLNQVSRLQGGPLLGGGGTGFLPSDLDNFDLWYDARDPSTITDVAGEASQWNSKGLVAANAVQLTPSNQPNVSSINGNPSLFFDGDDFLTVGGFSISVSPNTFFVAVTSTDNTGSQRRVFAFDEGTNLNMRSLIRLIASDDARATQSVSSGSSSSATIIGSMAEDTTVGFVDRQVDLGPSQFEDANGLTASDTNVGTLRTPADTIWIGSGTAGANGFGGHIHEIGVYSRFLSDVEKDQIIAYLTSKWGL